MLFVYSSFCNIQELSWDTISLNPFQTLILYIKIKDHKVISSLTSHTLSGGQALFCAPCGLSHDLQQSCPQSTQVWPPHIVSSKLPSSRRRCLRGLIPVQSERFWRKIPKRTFVCRNLAQCSASLYLICDLTSMPSLCLLCLNSVQSLTHAYLWFIVFICHYVYCFPPLSCVCGWAEERVKYWDSEFSVFALKELNVRILI